MNKEKGQPLKKINIQNKTKKTKLFFEKNKTKPQD
jgi:hypothetical protein